MPITDVRRPVRLLAAVSSAALATACAAGGPGTTRPETLHVADLTHVLDKTFPFIPVPGITFPFKTGRSERIGPGWVRANGPSW